MRTLRYPLILSLLTLFATAAGAATYYVDDAGSDSNPGTLSQPFATITHGLTFVEDPGDVLYVRGGTYNERAVIWDKHGQSGNEIWILNYDNEVPVIDGTGIGPHSTVSINESSYVRFYGFTVQNAPQTAILVWDADHITVKYCTVENAYKAGITAGSDSGLTHDILFQGNSVSDTVRENGPGSTLTSGWVQAMSCYRSDNCTFTENWIYENYGEGIDCILSDNCTITKNNLWDNKGSQVYLDNAQYALVDRNFIYHSGDSDYFRDDEPPPGITVANETYSVGQNPATNLTITNNIVLWCASGFVYYNSQYGGGLHYTLIANNTFYHSYSSGMRLIYIEDDNHDTTTVENNIFYQRTGVGYAWAPTTGFTWRTNNWYGGNSGTQITGSGDVTSDPQLASAGGWSATDYQLTSTSPLKTAGTANSVTTDHFGNARTASYSIGAHEY